RTPVIPARRASTLCSAPTTDILGVLTLARPVARGRGSRGRIRRRSEPVTRAAASGPRAPRPRGPVGRRQLPPVTDRPTGVPVHLADRRLAPATARRSAALRGRPNAGDSGTGGRPRPRGTQDRRPPASSGPGAVPPPHVRSGEPTAARPLVRGRGGQGLH